MNAVDPSVTLTSSASSLSNPVYSKMQYSGTGSEANADTNNALVSSLSSSSLDGSATMVSYNSTVGPASSSTIAVQKDVCGTTYFYTQGDYDAQPSDHVSDSVNVPNTTVYPGCLPHVAHMKMKTNLPSFFVSEELKMDILNRQLYTALNLEDSPNSGVPREVDNYNGLYPLEPAVTNPLHKSNTFGYHTTVYKALNVKDNMTYCLRRIHGYRLVNTKCMTAIEQWKKIQHPNLVHLREVFTTKTFSDNSMIFVYDFHPSSETLMSRHFSSSHVGVQHSTFPSANALPFRHSGSNSTPMLPPGSGVLLAESLIWTYVVQLSSILRTVHSHGLACRVIDPTKILLTDKTRIRLNCVGVFDVLSYDSNSLNALSQMEHYQQEDLVSLGRVILALANNSLSSLQNMQAAMVSVSRTYSADLKNLILYLMTPQARPRNINDIMPMIGARFYSQLELSHIQNDILENELSKEIENGRLLKLLCKLGTINERPECNMDTSWSETGDRYMLKLFRDFLFHQVDATGAPWIDMAHIIQCLNKLNAGVPEKVCLSSRDDEIILIVTYAELKRCVETSFGELTAPQRMASNSYS